MESFFSIVDLRRLAGGTAKATLSGWRKSPASLMFAVKQEVWLEISRISSRRKVTLKARFLRGRTSLGYCYRFSSAFSHTKPSDDYENVQKGKILIFRSCFCSAFHLLSGKIVQLNENSHFCCSVARKYVWSRPTEEFKPLKDGGGVMLGQLTCLRVENPAFRGNFWTPQPSWVQDELFDGKVFRLHPLLGPRCNVEDRSRRSGWEKFFPHTRKPSPRFKILWLAWFS